MLAYARSKLSKAQIARAQVRHGDIYALSLPDGVADAVVMHQVLHFLSEPALAIREAARVLAPGGRLLIVDFAPHDLEFLREEYAHDRLGFRACAGDAVDEGRRASSRSTQRDLAPSSRRRPAEAHRVAVARRAAPRCSPAKTGAYPHLEEAP